MDRAEAAIADPAAIPALILQEYGVPTVSLTKVRAVYRVDTPYGAFGFKNAVELPDLPMVAGFLDRIRRRGFDRMPAFVLSAKGQYLVSRAGQSYFMEEWLPYPEVPKRSLPYFERIGSALAAFHRAAKGIVPPADSPRREWGRREAYLTEAYRRIQAWIPRHAHRPERLRILRFLEARCRSALAAVRGISPEAVRAANPEAAVLCHGGLHHKNMLADDRGRIWFIDFETMVYAERVMDLAQFLQYHAGPYRWDPRAVNVFLDAYAARAAYPLGPEEWKLFYACLAFPRRFYNRMLRYFESEDYPEDLLIKLQETVEQDREKEPYLERIAGLIGLRSEMTRP